MPDVTYQPKVYRKQGGDELVVASGGVLNIETGGVFKANGTQAAAVASLTDNSGGTANDTVEDVPAAYNEAALANNFADLTAKINAILSALRGAGVIAP